MKDLPIEVQLVCARPKQTETIHSTASSVKTAETIILPENSANYSNQNKPTTDIQQVSDSQLQNYLDVNSQPFLDRLVKAKSDGSLAMTPITSIASTQISSELSKLRSRSLEPLSGLAMWSSEPQLIELMKGDRGLGFSILDYQVRIVLLITNISFVQ